MHKTDTMPCGDPQQSKEFEKALLLLFLKAESIYDLLCCIWTKKTTFSRTMYPCWLLFLEFVYLAFQQDQNLVLSKKLHGRGVQNGWGQIFAVGMPIGTHCQDFLMGFLFQSNW